jgi:hypothetical protein
MVAVVRSDAVLWRCQPSNAFHLASVIVSSSGPSSSRRQLAEMKQTLALARIARNDLREAAARSATRLAAALSELATIERRGEMARQIDDQETVDVAVRYAQTQRATIALLERKIAVEQDELALSEQTVAQMETELRNVTGIGPSVDGASAATGSAEDGGVDPSDFRPLDSAAKARAADERLAELKRRMGRS